MAIDIQLRDLVDRDYPVLFEHQSDAVAARMAAFGTRDPDATRLAERWKQGLASGSIVAQKAVVEGGVLIGFVACFLRDEKPEVTYWIARSRWGRGIATAALSQLLQLVTVRPIYASAAHDNAGSLRVLQKCGFEVRGTERGFANARGEEIEEVLLVLA